MDITPNGQFDMWIKIKYRYNLLTFLKKVWRKYRKKMLDIKVEQTQKAKHRETHKVKEKPVNAVALY